MKGKNMSRKPMPKEIEVPSWELFVEAVNVFKDDYEIVINHGGEKEKRVGFFDSLRPHLEYSVTGDEVETMTEAKFKEKLVEKPLVILIECMDKRGAYLGQEKVMWEILPFLEMSLEEVNLMTIAIGGGVIQRDKVIRNDEEIIVNRGEALQTILRFVAAHSKVEYVLATGHNHRCGAEAYAEGDKGWPERLGVEAGDEVENNKMKELIKEYTEKHLPKEWIDQEKVEMALVKFASDPEKNPRVEFEFID